MCNVFKWILSIAYKEINKIKSEYTNKQLFEFKRRKTDDGVVVGNHKFTGDEIEFFENDSPIKIGTIFFNPKRNFNSIQINDRKVAINNEDVKKFDAHQVYLFTAYNYMIKVNKKQRVVNLIIYTHYLYQTDFSKLDDFSQQRFFNVYKSGEGEGAEGEV